MSEPMFFYRYDQIDFEDGPRLRESIFILIKETLCGWWIGHGQNALTWLNKPKWVSKTSRKRFAYPTKKEALENFISRKRRQITMLNYQLERAGQAWELAEAKLKELAPKPISQGYSGFGSDGCGFGED